MDARSLTRLGTLRQLEIFLKVAEHKSMTRAAEELYLSHSAVSLQIRKLSDAIGMPHEMPGLDQLPDQGPGHQQAHDDPGDAADVECPPPALWMRDAVDG